MEIITIHRHSENESNNADQNKPDIIKQAVDYMAQYGNHFNKESLEYALSNMKNVDKTDHRFSITDIEQYINNNNSSLGKSNLFDITYTANMAYADFYLVLIFTEQDCIKYALAVANDVDGYEGIEFCRWLADLMGKNISVDWKKLI